MSEDFISEPISGLYLAGGGPPIWVPNGLELSGWIGLCV